MANTSKEINYAGRSLVVDSIKVLGKIDNAQLREINTRVRAMQQMQDSYNTQQKNYWSALAADDIITPDEKKTLFKEWEIIQNTYTKLESEAVERGIQDTSFFNTYETYYNTLDTLLNTTLKLFEKMQQNTKISDRAAFNEAYSNYYTFEHYCQTTLSDALTENYWTQITADNMISPVEKKSLLQQIKQITGRFTGYKNQAQAKGFLGQTWWNQFEEDYDALYDYLYTTLALFVDMEETTVIDSRETFQQLFDTYNQEETFVSVTLNESIMGSLGFRTLNDLSEPGVEGEVGLYHGQIYQYVVSEGTGMWVPVGAEGYAGVLHDLPIVQNEGQYFLCDEDFVRTLPLNVMIMNQGAKEIRELIINGNTLCTDYKFESGYIYLYQQGVWTKLTNRSDYRYLQVMLEYWNITGELPQVFQDVIVSAAQQEVQRQVDNFNIPHYLGPSDMTAPAVIAHEGDWFLYTGTTQASRTNSIIYVYRNNVWTPTDPTDASQGEKYMAALNDILKENNASPGYFSALFCAALYANTVFTNLLNSSHIVLCNWTDGQGVEHNGIIEGNYNAQAGKGFRIENNGNAVFNQGTFKGNVTADSLTLGESASVPGNKVSGTVANATNIREGYISKVKMDHSSSELALSTDNWNPDNPDQGFAIYKNGNCYFNNGHFRGELIGATGTFNEGNFNNINVGGNSRFTGEIFSGPLVLSSETPVGKSANITSNKTTSEAYRILVNSGFRFGTWYNCNPALSKIDNTYISSFKFEVSRNAIIQLQLKTAAGTYLTYNYNSGTASIGHDIYINTTQSGTATFKLINLPTSEPSESGAVWNDNGTLKIRR